MYSIENSYYSYLGLLLILCCSGVVFVQFLKPTDLKCYLGTKRRPMPPGPPGVPILGNLPQMMQARRETLLFNKWLASLIPYGEMVTLRMGSKTWVLLNSDRVVSEIIAKRGKITNERPHMPVASDLVSNGKRTVIRQEAEWREGRRVMHQLLSGSNLKVYAGMQELESMDMLRRYLREPNLWFAHNYRYATSVLYRIVMGYPLNKTKAQLDDYQRVTIEFVTAINRSYVDFFPSVSKLPHFLQPWRRFWAQMGSFHRHVFQEWWDPIKTAVSKGSAPPSFVRDVLLHPDVRFTGDDEEAMYLATSVMAAGGDNTRMTMNVFIMAMVTRPEAQLRAREEVDRVCTDGDSLRLPRMADLPAMPYVAAMIKEVLRWRPTVPVVPPHQLTEDLEFDGYFIPSGTCFLVNSIGLSSEFDNAYEFRPERWNEDLGADRVPNFWGFGGGRRICVGWKVAEQALFIAFARLLYCFEMSPNGPINDEKLNHQALNEPFPVKTTVRSAGHALLIEEEASKYEASFSTFGVK
ncbi:cytochrome P450 [Colletotrichum navitas]|uniref:Cytochrome P450 n=1 Tax=Colletotrichum navitas TaxID=681940 RepID=A0AAD8UX88_9PEZI|nr:cytochrome P450 [Colletotrichum navitas]KAK1570180.1 cytochrome P450 [Colletotrichum navitas]